MVNGEIKIMANSKRRCMQCKKYQEAEKGIAAPIGFFCCKDCRFDYATKKPKALKKKADKFLDDKFKAKKKVYNDSDTSKQHRLTQASYNRLRVLQEIKWFKSRGLEPQCISCGKENMDFCCGHLKSRGAQGNLRYDVNNTFLQCNRYCNMALSGNIEGNKTTRGYKVGLAERFGTTEAARIIDYCDSNTQVKKWTGVELVALRKEINKQIKLLA
jgi:hypothetical protein